MRTQNARLHIFRAMINVVATACIFYVLPHVPLAEVNMIGQTYPFILMVLATYVLKEPVKAKQYLACVLGFIGVLLIVRPSGDINPVYGLLVLVSATLNATGDLLVRWLTRKDSELAITLWFFFLSSIFSGVWCLFEIDQIDLNWMQWQTLICAGILGGGGQYFLAKSYKRLKVGTMAVYSYLSLCLSIIFGWMIFHEIPTLWMVAGGLFIMAGVQWNYLVSKPSLSR